MIDTATKPEREPVASEAEGAPAPAAAPHAKKSSRGLLAIGLFKLGKAIFFFALGMGALHLVHKNLGDVLLRMENALHFDPEGEFAGMLQDKVDLVSGRQLRQVSIASVGYSIIALTEGIGLMMQQTWAEYMTLILTTGALPWELYEIVRRPSWMRVAVLVINLAVLGYLLWFLRAKRRRAAAEAA